MLDHIKWTGGPPNIVRYDPARARLVSFAEQPAAVAGPPGALKF
jgi:hypothetical protein